MQNKVVIITGGSSGLGRATAELMAAEGARVVIADVADDSGRRVAKEIGAKFMQVDVSDAASVDALVNGVRQEYGRLDVMCNNAGVFLAAPIIDTTDAGFARTVAVNFGGCFNGTRAAGRVMAAQGSGVIINTASNGGSFVTEGMSVYCATKAAIIALSKAASMELAPKGVRVNTISPGTMLTGMVPPGEEVVKMLDKLQPIGYAANPKLIAAGIMFLASDEAAYVAGTDLIIDGAATAGHPIII